MKLIDTNDFLLGSHGLNRFRESLVSKLVMYILRLHKLDKLNVKVNDDDPEGGKHGISMSLRYSAFAY